MCSLGHCVWVVAENGRKPLLDLLLFYSLSLRVRLYLVFADLIATEIVGVGVGEVETANRGSWVHSQGLG